MDLNTECDIILVYLEYLNQTIGRGNGGYMGKWKEEVDTKLEGQGPDEQNIEDTRDKHTESWCKNVGGLLTPP